MTIKKYVSLAASMAAVAGLALAMPAFAQTHSAVGQMHAGSGMFGSARMAARVPGVIGTVSAISGNTLTVSGRQGFSTTTPATTYTVDASNATVTKNNASGSVSSIAIGDIIFVQGTISGTNVTATTIRDGVMMGQGRGNGANKNSAGGLMGMMGAMGIRGTVESVNGTTLTVMGKQGFSSTTAATAYTVDASSAAVIKNGQTSSVSSIATGDTIMVQGTVSGTTVTAKTIRDGMPAQAMQGNGQPVVAGSVTAISGNTITIANKSNVTYIVDATSAKFVVKGVSSPTISNIAVGDNLVIQGAVNSNNVTASSVIDQKPASTNISSTTGQQPKSSGIIRVLGGVGSFFKHLFGF